MSKMTPRRFAILEVIRTSNSHPTAFEVYDLVRRRMPRISMGTVYRNLDILTEMELVTTVEGGHQRRYEVTEHPHYHIRCIRCDALIDAPIDVDTELENKVQRATHWEIIGHKTEFYGLCPLCRNNSK